MKPMALKAFMSIKPLNIITAHPFSELDLKNE
jgi:hypothetical protein